MGACRKEFLFLLSPEEKGLVKQAALAVIESQIRKQPVQEVLENKQFAPLLEHPILKECRGAFITLKKNGGLRGCIGTFSEAMPLFHTIIAMAPAAAFKDPRFSPVTLDELIEIEIECSILGRRRRIHMINEIRLGKHGVYFDSQGHHSCFLPEIPIEQGWDLQSTLAHLSLKAGLDESGWQEPNAIIEIFETERF